MNFPIMNKGLIFSSILSLLMASLGVNAADNVAINITGNVVASPCVMSTSSTLTLDLGQNIQATTLNKAGATSSWAYVDMKFNTCPAGTTKVTLTFSGTPDATNPDDLYANTGGDAKDVAIQFQGNSSELLGNGKTYSGPVDANHAVSFRLWGRAYAKTDSVMPGTISTSIVAAVTYQ